MKEHVKWWKIRSQECTTDFYDTEASWRAALEWVLSNLDGKTDILELGLRIREEQDYE